MSKQEVVYLNGNYTPKQETTLSSLSLFTTKKYFT